MKVNNYLFIIFTVLFMSCNKDDSTFTTPSTFEYETYINLNSYAYQVTGGQWVEISNAPDPVTDFYLNNGSYQKLEFLDAENLMTYDDGEERKISYSTKSNILTMGIDGQKIEMAYDNGDKTITFNSIASGQFSDPSGVNTYVSSLCGDLANCDNFDQSDFLLSASAFGEGTIQYIITKTEVYKAK